MAERLLMDGGKVKVTIMFRGREITYTSFGKRLLDRMAVDMAPIATIERDAKLEGKNMFMILAPRAVPTGPPKFTSTAARGPGRSCPDSPKEPPRMPKIRTHRGTAKRVKVSANGKVTHRHQFSGCGHILSKKTRKRKRNFRKDQPVFSGDLKRFAPQIPYLL